MPRRAPNKEALPSTTTIEAAPDAAVTQKDAKTTL